MKPLAGKDMGFTDLISRSRSGKAVSPSHYDKQIVVVTIKKINNVLNPTDNGKLIRNTIGSNLMLSFQFLN